MLAVTPLNNSLFLVIMAGQKHIQEGEIDRPLYILFALCLVFLVWLSSKLNWYVPAMYPAVIVLLYIVLNKLMKDKSALASTAIGLFSSCLCFWRRDTPYSLAILH